jgi:hypothetical protein
MEWTLALSILAVMIWNNPAEATDRCPLCGTATRRVAVLRDETSIPSDETPGCNARCAAPSIPGSGTGHAHSQREAVAFRLALTGVPALIVLLG